MKRVRRPLFLETLERRSLLNADGISWPEAEATDPMPGFSLTDVSPNSATSNRPVSPRDYLEQVSAWYFTHAT